MKCRNAVKLLLLSTMIFLTLHCGKDGDRVNGTDGRAQKATDVKVITLSTASFRDYIDVTGHVQADIATVVSAEEQGVVQRFFKEKGDWVDAGEVVLSLKSKVLQANYDEAKASYLLSKATFERQANLYKDKVIPEQKYLEYKYTYDRDKARFDMLSAKLEKTTIVSPVPGYLDERFVEIGEFILPGRQLFRIVKTDTVKITAGVPETYVQDIRKGTPVDITVDVLPDLKISSRVSYVGPSIDKGSRTFPIEIRFKNPQGKLKPEMFANLKIARAAVDNAIVIPRDAVIETESHKYVFLARDGTARRQDISIGGAYGNQIWVSSGLQPGQRLIVTGHRDLVDGEPIVVHN